MNTDTTSTTSSDEDEFDPAALDVAMRAHPVVVTAINRVARRAKAAETARDAAISERDAAKRDHKQAMAQLEVTKNTLANYTKAFGGQPPVMLVPAGPTDAELAKIVADMTPMEKAIALTKAAPVRRFSNHSAPAMEGIFGS